MENKILIIDIETTGFLPNGHLLEVGIVELDITTGEKKELYNKLMTPQHLTVKEIREAWPVKEGYINPFEIVTAQDIEECLPEVQAIIDQYPLGATAFNNKFDFDFLESYGINIPVKLPCPMLLSTNICKLPGRYGNYKWPKAEEAYNHFYPEANYKEIHRGLDDAMHEADIVYELIKLGVFTINSEQK